jgi:hypothetical protein
LNIRGRNLEFDRIARLNLEPYAQHTPAPCADWSAVFDNGRADYASREKELHDRADAR